MKITANATMIMSALFTVLCLGTAITGFTSMGEITDPVQLADAKGFAWFWTFLAGTAAAFGLAACWLVRTQPEEGDS